MRGTLSLIAGVALLAIALPALADSSPSVGPDWQTVATTVCGALFLGVGAYLRGQGQRMDKIQENHAVFRDMVLREFMSKGDAEKAIVAGNAVVTAQLEALTREIAGLAARIDGRKGETS